MDQAHRDYLITPIKNYEDTARLLLAILQEKPLIDMPGDYGKNLALILRGWLPSFNDFQKRFLVGERVVLCKPGVEFWLSLRKEKIGCTICITFIKEGIKQIDLEYLEIEGQLTTDWTFKDELGTSHFQGDVFIGIVDSERNLDLLEDEDTYARRKAAYWGWNEPETNLIDWDNYTPPGS